MSSRAERGDLILYRKKHKIAAPVPSEAKESHPTSHPTTFYLNKLLLRAKRGNLATSTRE